MSMDGSGPAHRQYGGSQDGADEALAGAPRQELASVFAIGAGSQRLEERMPKSAIDAVDLSVLFLREIDALGREVELYPADAAVWKEIPGMPNTGGTLVLHLVGNLRSFIGSTIGGGTYVRDREAEFALRDVPRAALLSMIAATRREVESALPRLSASMLEAPFPIVVGGRQMSTKLFVLHLLSHLAYHLGQIDCHRRASTGDSASANTLPLAALGEASGPPKS